MALDAHTALDALVVMVETIQHDRKLRRWFDDVAAKPEDERRLDILRRSEQLQAAGEDPEIVAAFRMLSDPRIFDAARLALDGDA